MYSALIAENDVSLARRLAVALRREGFRVLQAADGKSALRLAHKDSVHVVVLEVGLPDIDGVEMCRRLRSHPRTSGASIVMISERRTEFDIVVGFAVGADDYLTKPFSMPVLVSRVKALLRRGSTRRYDRAHKDLASYSGITVDRQKHLAACDGRPLQHLTHTEFRLLDALVRRPERVFSREELVRIAFNDHKGNRGRSVDVRICHLRKKLGQKGELIQTVRATGYCLRADRES